MITVCMATYNGEKFIEKQLSSILSQLEVTDEVIIVDDCSSDQTVSLIKKMNIASPIKVTIDVNQQNQGPIGSFQKAISKAKGDYIFLSDQDDQWLPNKVEMVMKAFKETKADLVVHDSLVVDGKGNRLNDSWNEYNANQFSETIIKNIKKNGYTGCMMAFTSTLARKALPFPEKIEMHDQWLALVAIVTHSKIVLIKEPLMNYVRHGGNVTGMKQRKITTMILGRLRMLKYIMTYRKRSR
ncbi:glycosyltransferase family 2 protein [uncultured Vagococcus sp.]|uniref:glycosyltransferase family 2 protein n=1 Tax=uncultured Vagococcus sp. TaxID=189676 RepID=UPI0028D70408|nr:glycosyltransferase family 2 protein [uncultured Vagococcus sp.]